MVYLYVHICMHVCNKGKICSRKHRYRNHKNCTASALSPCMVEHTYSECIGPELLPVSDIFRYKKYLHIHEI